MFPVALNLYFFARSFTNYIQDLQILEGKNVQVFIKVSSFAHNPVYLRFKTKHDTLIRCENGNAENH